MNPVANRVFAVITLLLLAFLTFSVYLHSQNNRFQPLKKEGNALYDSRTGTICRGWPVPVNLPLCSDIR